MKYRGCLLAFACLLSFTSQARCDDQDNLSKVSQANLKFTLDFYKAANSVNGLKKFVASPFSVSSLFTMLLMGANGQTAQEIRNTLGFDQVALQSDQIKSGYGRILESPRRALGADVANALWSSKSFQIKQDYVDSLKTSFKAKEDELDFSSSGATDTINSWVNDATGGKITSLFDDPLPTSTLLVLVNAIYFKANWKVQFPISETRDQTFFGEDGNSLVPMMHVKDEFPYARSMELSADVLEMAYGDSNISMVVLLPFKNSDLKTMEGNLTPDALLRCFDILKPAFPSLDVYLPRFKLEEKFNLIPIMNSLNTNAVFGSGADLSGISDAGGLFVTQAVQKAFIEVNEEGTTAAAASGVSVSRTMTPVFKADRPFLFLIRNKGNNLVSFIGRYA